MSPQSRGRQEAIVWACIARDGIVLVESCPRRDDLPWDGAREAIRSLLAKEPTLGWDVSSSASTPALGGGNQQNVVGCGNDKKEDAGAEHEHEQDEIFEEHRTFRGLRFPVYEVNEERANRVRVWTFSCAYNPRTVTKRRAQAFLEKVVAINEFFRETPEWKKGQDHSCQDGFGQILQQRMDEMADPKLAAVIDETLDLSAQIVKLNRAVLNSVRLQESSRCLDGSNSSSFSSSSSSFKQENWNPASSIASRTGLFKRRGESKSQPLQLQQHHSQQPEHPTDAPRAAGPPAPSIVPHRPSLKFVARSVAQRDAANRSAPPPPGADPLAESIEHRNDERPSLGRSRTDSMEDFLQALEREACMPQQQQQPAAAAAPASKVITPGESGDTTVANDDGDNKAHGPSRGEGSPSRSRRRAGGTASAGTGAASRAETLAILVVMMLSCLLATLPQSILKAPVLKFPGGGYYGDRDEA